MPEHNNKSSNSAELIISKILCYIQNKMDVITHNLMIKTVVEFHSIEEIHAAKVMLFEKCIMTTTRIKKDKNDVAKMSCKFNRVWWTVNLQHDGEPSTIWLFIAMFAEWFQSCAWEVFYDRQTSWTDDIKCL